MKKIAIFDLDNCLADDEWRAQFIDFGASNMHLRYAAYHSRCGGDIAPRSTALLALQDHLAQGHCVVIVTARPTFVRAITERWLTTVLLDALDKHCAPLPSWRAPDFFPLMMRNEDDHRSSVEIKREHLLVSLPEFFPGGFEVVAAYDDREDIVAMYRDYGIQAVLAPIHQTCMLTPPTHAAQSSQKPAPVTAATILHGMRETFLERSAVYKDNYVVVGKVMEVLYPDGMPGKTAGDFELMHLWVLMLVKLTRFVTSGHSHRDSVHDMAVYAAMIEAILQRQDQQQKGQQ